MAVGTGDVAGQQFTGKLADDAATRRRVNKMHPVANYIGMGDRLQYLTKEGHYEGPSSDAVKLTDSGTGIAANLIAYESGYNTTSGFREITVADEDTVAETRNLWFLPVAAVASADTVGFKHYLLTAQNTSTWGSAGDPVYLGAAGALSPDIPTTGYTEEIGVCLVKSASIGVISIDIAGEGVPVHDHTDNGSGGAVTVGAALTGTSQDTFTISVGADEAILDTTGLSQDSTFTFFDSAGPGELLSHESGVLMNTLTDLTTMAHDHADAAGGGLIAASSSATGTTNASFTIDSDANGAILSASGLSQASTFTFPDEAGPDEVMGIAATQTVTNKTFTDPTINACTITGAVTITTPTVTGTWTDLGTVTTADINGGTIDGVTIGAGAAPTVTDLGTVATCDINGGSIDGCTIGAASPSTIVGTTLNVTDANIETIVVDDATTPTISLATGKTNTGTFTILGKTSGSFVISTADATAQAVTLTVADQTAGASSVTIPDLANSADTLVVAALAQVLTNKTIDGDDNTVQDLPYSIGKAAQTVNDAKAGVTFMLSFEVVSADLVHSFTVPAGKTLRVIDATIIKTVGAGAAGDTVKLSNSGGSDITDTISVNVADKIRIPFTTIDDAQTDVAAGDTLDATGVEAGSDVNCRVQVLCMFV